MKTHLTPLFGHFNPVPLAAPTAVFINVRVFTVHIHSTPRLHHQTRTHVAITLAIHQPSHRAVARQMNPAGTIVVHHASSHCEQHVLPDLDPHLFAFCNFTIFQQHRQTTVVLNTIVFGICHRQLIQLHHTTAPATTAATTTARTTRAVPSTIATNVDGAFDDRLLYPFPDKSNGYRDIQFSNQHPIGVGGFHDVHTFANAYFVHRRLRRHVDSYVQAFVIVGNMNVTWMD